MDLEIREQLGHLVDIFSLSIAVWKVMRIVTFRPLIKVKVSTTPTRAVSVGNRFKIQ